MLEPYCFRRKMMTGWERHIDSELKEAGISAYELSSITNAAGNLVIRLTINQHTASGPPDLFLDAINEVRQNNIPITDAFESRGMYD